MRHHHFKPARLGIFAIYYPATILGWSITFTLVALLIFFFQKVDQNSHSVSDTLINFAPYAIAILLIFDLLCFRMGEYPSWWRKRKDVESKES
ncbi:MAG: Uncharacterized protein G01um101420_821 [Parcubacteria group bacterium Gr01-1014_20]|nr:MAG: Uncharacterized protein G01um101420_821 [Parcubacteria group bacterium Gr01-1014_20]